jgi:5'-3' exonuclease
MNPREELEFLKGFIQLSEGQATKRDNIEAFLNEGFYTLLVDADSMLYNVVHAHRENEYDAEEMYLDFNKQIDAVKWQIEDDGFDVEDVIVFFTTCRKNFRKTLLPSYKANRKPNEMMQTVSLFKSYVIQMLEEDFVDVRYSDTLEADDLVGIEAKLISNGVVIAIDKDLRQIKGAHFNYYKDKVKSEYGNTILVPFETPTGYQIMIEKKAYRGWSYTTEQEGYELLLKQCLVGDNSDNIKGANGVGAVKADKLLDGRNNFGKLRAVYEAYTILCVKDLELDYWEITTPTKYKKHKGEKVTIFEKNRLKLNISLMKL